MRIILMMVCIAVIMSKTMLIAFDGELIGKIGEVNTFTGEIIVQSPQAAAKIKMGSKLYVRINGRVVIITATYPMQTVAKCKLVSSNAGYLGQIRKGIPVYCYVAGVETRVVTVNNDIQSGGDSNNQNLSTPQKKDNSQEINDLLAQLKEAKENYEKSNNYLQSLSYSAYDASNMMEAVKAGNDCMIWNNKIYEIKMKLLNLGYTDIN